MSVSAQLRKLMKQNRMTTPRLSRESGVPVPSIKSILSGQSQNPRGNTLISLSKALNCSIPELLSDESADVPPLQSSQAMNHSQADEAFIQILRTIDTIATQKGINLSSHNEFKKQCAKRIFDNTYRDGNSNSIDPVYAEWVFESLWKN